MLYELKMVQSGVAIREWENTRKPIYSRNPARGQKSRIAANRDRPNDETIVKPTKLDGRYRI